MLRFDRRLLLNVDWILVATTLFIIMLSVLSLWSLAPRGGSVLAWRQLSWAGIGLVAMLVVISIDYRQLVRAAPVFYVAGLSLLFTVFVLGRTVSGARRWIHLGPFTVQPSELFKLIFVLALAWALTAWRTPSSSSRGGVLTTFAIIAVPFVLVVRQPDLGTALVLVPVAVAVLVGIGVRLQVLGGLALGGLATRGIIASFEASNAVDIDVVDATSSIPVIAIATVVSLALLASVVVRGAARRPVAVTLRGAA
jgi:rod shape determining protein RodA